MNIFKADKYEKYIVDLSNYNAMTPKDYLDQISAYEVFYFNSIGNKEIELTKVQKQYLDHLIKTIDENNEIFFVEDVQAEVSVIQDERPFHFSLPNRKIFISSGLLKKYIRSEKLLYCLLVYELIRSEKKLYKMQRIIPTGYMDTSRILALTRLTTEEKVEVHKWAFYLLNRIGLDTDIYLSWIQIQNRNSLDFSMQLGDVASISREESLFKAFLIRNTDKKLANSRRFTGSSKQFYNFINGVK